MKEAGNFNPVEITPATIQSGETPLAIDWDYLNAGLTETLSEQGVEWQVAVPSDGLFGGYYSQAISAYAPHPAAARLWQEFLYSDEGQNIWLAGGARPVRLLADRQDVLAALDAGDRDDRRLVEDDAATLYIDKGIGRPQVDRHVGGQQPQHPTDHCHDGSKLADRAVACARLTAADQILFAVNALTASPSNRQGPPPVRGSGIAPCSGADPCGSPVPFQAARILRHVRKGRCPELFRFWGSDSMNKAALVKHSVRIAGHATSVSLEPVFWQALCEIAARRGIPVNALLTEIDAARGGNLSSAIRVFVLECCRRGELAPRTSRYA